MPLSNNLNVHVVSSVIVVFVVAESWLPVVTLHVCIEGAKAVTEAAIKSTRIQHIFLL
jgi:hypothetical protein